MEKMQKIATNLFVVSSVVFGVVGILLVILEQDNTAVGQVLLRILWATVFIILPSFALSVAGKYLNGKS